MTSTESKKLPDERAGHTTHLTIGGIDGYVTVNTLPAGGVREVFVRLAKIPGRDETYDTLSTLLDAVAMCMSKALVAGVPLSWFIKMFRRTKFEPSGRTNLVGVGGRPYMATSPLDALARILEAHLPPEEREPEQPLFHRPTANTDGDVVPACGAESATRYVTNPIELTCQGCIDLEPKSKPFVRCTGDGVNSCGHTAHDGPCKSGHAGMTHCHCTGTPK